MKSYTLVVLAVACLVFEHAMARPERTMLEKAQDKLDQMKSGASEASQAAQDAAAKALEATKTSVHDAVQAAQQISQQGIDTGREWIEHGKSIATGLSNETLLNKE